MVVAVRKGSVTWTTPLGAGQLNGGGGGELLLLPLQPVDTVRHSANRTCTETA